MKVILQQDVRGQGKKGQMIDAAEGYARNYLLPRKLAIPATADAINNPGAHGLSEILYNYSSAGGNNGSAFAGMGCDTPFLNTSIGLVMLFVRFVPMTAAIVIAGSMVAKKKVAESAGTLSTTNAMFIFLLILIVLIVGALSFFPALSLGPIAEYTQMLGLG